MLQTQSPYALLCASKPKQPAATATEYDLFSLSQADAALAIDPLVPPANHLHACDAPAAHSTQRTHYISDIQNRHTNANRHTLQHSGLL